eukprot:scaffold5709_cov100-Cylindrotheca_fusiformis.AAC.3
MQATNTSSNALPSPLERFLKNNLHVSDYDSIQVVADNAKLPQANGDDSIVQDHLSPSTRSPRRIRSMKEDRWGSSLVEQDEEEENPSLVPIGGGADAMLRRQDSLDRYFRDVLVHLEDDLPPPVAPLLDIKSLHRYECKMEEAPSIRPMRNQAKTNVPPEPSRKAGPFDRPEWRREE